MHPWSFTAEDYHRRFRVHRRWFAVDANPLQLGFADGSHELSLPLPRPTPIYLAELLALYLAMAVPPPRALTLYG